MHVRFCNILDDNGNIEVPCTDRLVIGGRDKSPVFVHEGDCIHWSEMLIVLLRDVARVHVILSCQMLLRVTT